MKDFDVKYADLQGIHLVEANAGTGKTYNISSLFVRLIAETDYEIHKLLVLTFTEAATVEIRQRIQSRCREVLERLEQPQNQASDGDEFLEHCATKYGAQDNIMHRLQQAIIAFDESQISTIHGFCQKLLRDYPFQFGVNPDFELLPNPKPMLLDVIRFYWRMFFSAEEHWVKNLFQDTFLHTAKGIRSPEEFYAQFGDTLYNEFPIHPKSALSSRFEEYCSSRSVSFSLHSLIQFIEETSNPNDWADIGVEEEKKQLFHTLTELWIRELRRLFSDEKKNRGLLDYDDLIRVVARGIMQSNLEFLTVLRQSYPVALIDEFQDTDTYQFTIFKTLFEGFPNGTLYLIGDPKQAIFGFRGADIHTYLEAKNWVTKENHYKLSYNYRSNPELLEFTNQFFTPESSGRPFWLDIDYQDSLHPSTVVDSETQMMASYDNHVWLDSEGMQRMHPIQWISITGYTSEQTRAAIMDDLVKRVEYLLNSSLFVSKKSISGVQIQELQPSDIAILVHTNNQASDIQELLSRQGIPSIINVQESIYQSSEAEYIQTWLNILQNPNNEKRINYVLAHPIGSLTAKELRTQQEDGSFWAELLTTIQKSAVEAKRKEVARVLRDLFKYLKVYDRWPLRNDFERIVTNIDHILEIIQLQQNSKGLGINGLIHFIDSQKSEYRLEVDEDIIRINTDEQMVNIVTTHRSKGLQYPVVFCPFESAGKTPILTNKVIKYRFEGRQCYDIRLVSKAQDLHTKPLVSMMSEEIANRIRLTYVSITRAESLCVIYNHTGMSGWNSGLLTTCMDKDLLGSLIETKMRNPKKKPPSDSSWHADTLASHIWDTLSERYKPIRAWSYTQMSPIQMDIIPSGVSKDSSEFQYNELTSLQSLQKFTRIHSYTSLKHHIKDEDGLDRLNGFSDLKDLDRVDVEKEDTDRDEKQTSCSSNQMPRGAEIGSFFHRLMEQLLDRWVLDEYDYREWVLQESRNFGLTEAHSENIYSWVSKTMNTEVIPGCLLRDLQQGQLVVEKPFLIPSDTLQPEKIYSLIRGKDRKLQFDSSLDIKVLPKGFFKGFIDLVFECEGKFYVLDYKTNKRIGERAYSPIQLTKAMVELDFDVQGHLYSLALHQFLSVYMREYDYDQHYGGYVYVFVRGLDPENPENGIYHHKPDTRVITSLLDELLPQEVQE